MGIYAAAAGAIMGGIGSIFGAGEARKTRNMLMDLANTPGLDIDSEVANAIAGYEQNLPGASRVAGGVNRANQSNINELLGIGLPGYEGLRDQNLSNIGAELRGEIPPDVQAAIERATAGRAIGGGYGGSQFHRNLTARDLGLTSLNLTQKGGADLLKTIQGTPLANPFGVQTILGPSVSDRIGVRSNERTQKLNMLTGAIKSPTDLAVIAQYLQQQGGALEGAGLSSMLPTKGAGSGTGGSLNPQAGGGYYSSQFGGG